MISHIQFRKSPANTDPVKRRFCSAKIAKMISSANARCMPVAFLILSPAAELQASSVAAGLGLGKGLAGVASYNIDKMKIVLTRVAIIPRIAESIPDVLGQ